MKPVRKIKVIYRNWFFRTLGFFLPRNVILKSMFRGKNIYSVFFIGEVYDVRIRHIDFWHFRDRILFRVLMLTD